MSTVGVPELLRDVLSQLQCVSGPSASGNYSARCPLHDDRASSFSIHAKSGLWRCHAAGCGRHGNVHRLAEEMAITARQTATPMVNWGLDASMNRLGVTVNAKGVVFPLIDHAGKRQRDHVRLHSGEPRFQYWGKGQTLHALVDWQLVRDWGSRCGIAYLVEGDRDWLTLAAHELPAIGILGTEHFAKGREESFGHIKAAGVGAIVITPDNDDAGERASSEWARILRQDGFAVGIRALPKVANGRTVKDMFDLYRAAESQFEGWLSELPVHWS